jgi:hypothetical protein
MKHFIVAAGLYTLCSAQGSASPSGYVYGAYVNESNDVHDLAIQLLDTCPALDLPGTNERCRNAPVNANHFQTQPTPKQLTLFLNRPK